MPFHALLACIRQEGLDTCPRTTKPLVRETDQGVAVYTTEEVVNYYDTHRKEWRVKPLLPPTPLYHGPLAKYWTTQLTQKGE